MPARNVRISLAGGLQPAAGALVATREPIRSATAKDRPSPRMFVPRIDRGRIRIIEPGTISVVTISETRGRRALRLAARVLVRRSGACRRDVVERLRQRHAELLGLQLRGHEGSERLGLVARRAGPGTRRGGRAEVHLAQRDEHLLAHRPAERLRDAQQRAR